MSGLEGIMMGNVSETASESDEQIQARISLARQKIAQIKKDEKSAKDFDMKLAHILPKLSQETLEFVIFLIDHEVPSLTVLAMLAVESDDAGQICYAEFHKYILEAADFSIVKFKNSQVEKKVSLWWTFIFAANHISKTTKLNDFRKDDEFIRRISSDFSRMLKNHLIENQDTEFNDRKLKKILKKYADALFSEDPLKHFE